MAKSKAIKISLKIIAITLAVILGVALSYVLYVVIDYNRLDDNVTLTAEGSAENTAAEIGREYTAVSQNLGFGAYTADFTFFMDGGKQSRAESKESVINSINSAVGKCKEFSPDFLLFQEADTDSTRSHHVNQQAMLTSAFENYKSVAAVNYHSAYLMYPIFCPHGKSNSGIVTLSNTEITSAIRRKLPISNSFSKFLDLDRCYSVSRIPTENGKELVLYNVHLSAYGGSDEIRTAQMTMLFDDMKSEYQNGNYCVCGGDFNHDFTGDSTQKLNGLAGTDYGWAQPFPIDLLPEGLTRCTDYSDGQFNPTCRNCDVPYKEGNFVIVVDGFIVSNNVTVNYLSNVVTGFTYSDHNPVVIKFTLNA